MLKICGEKCNANFDFIHTRKLIKVIIESYKKNPYNMNLMELIAGFTFALTGDFDTILNSENDLEKDKKQTLENISKIYIFLNVEKVEE
ncbi:MAG: hypothetical protein HFJ30_00265 [Clostridia bacterium]|nr:hypothetical protein [Clostridia bacterium]